MDVKIAERDKVKVADADDIFRIMRRILLREEKIDQGKEHFWILGLEGNNRLLFIELVSIGGNTKVSVNPREVFQVAVQKGAVRAVLVHNHPDGALMPSDEDEKLTDRLIQAGRLLGIEVIEHLIYQTNHRITRLIEIDYDQLSSCRDSCSGSESSTNSFSNASRA
uniref:RadC-like JAB domain-containing protein n=1 Tax=Candidatus Kentrum sp. LFY TaxID=2126342 RepID=A0A450WUY5_9GAMM|nr:MAG: RadC-like JAB domain-containing protein [Candidatus Kentron sp. LFY]